MKALSREPMQLYEQILKEFDERFCVDYTPWGSEEEVRGMASDINPTVLKSFLKQSFIKFLDGECERLENSKKENSLEFTCVCEYGGACDNCLNKKYNQALSDTISHYQNMIKELQNN